MDQPAKVFQPTVVWDNQVEAYLRQALGDERFERTAAALSRPPRTTCMRVNTLKTSPQEVVNMVRQLMGPCWADDVVQVHPQVPCAVILRGSGPHQVSYEAAGEREAVVSRKAGEAVLRGAPVYAPGVLAVSSGVSRGSIVALSVVREKPGSDTPEITRGTTLYDIARGDAATVGCGPGSVVTDGTVALCAVSPSSPPTRCSEEAAQAALAPTQSAAAAAAVAAADASDASTLPPPPPASTSSCAAAATTASRSPRRRRQRPRRRHGSGDPPVGLPPPHSGGNAGSTGAGSAATGSRDPAADCGSELVRHNGRGPDPPTAAAAAPPPAAGTVVAAVGPPAGPPVLPPGWTPSSQGPLPPRTGMYIGLARAAMSRQEMFRSREGLALELVEPVFRVPPAVAGLPSGWVMLQNLPSIVAALVLAPAPGSRVLDMCAAPGGKATLLAQLMGDNGEVVALDRTHSKVGEITSLARELGVTCVRPQKMDAGRALSRPTGHEGDGDKGRDGAVAAAAAAAGAVFESLEAGLVIRVVEASGDGQGDGGGLQVAGAACSKDVVDVVAKAATGAAATGTCQGVPTHVAAAPVAERRGGVGGSPAAAAETAAATTAGAPPMSDKARQRDERRRAAMIKRGITPPPPPHESSSGGSRPTTFPAESFDSLLLDAPCSALGLRPRLQQHASALYLRQCAAAQRRLVDSAVRLLRVGGSMVYSTCTINPGENEAVVRYLLDKYGNSFRLVPAGPPLLGSPGLVGRHPTMAEAGVLLAPHRSPHTHPHDDGDDDDGGGKSGGGKPRKAAAPVVVDGTCRTCRTSVDPGGPVAAPAGAGGGEVWLTEAEAALVQRFDPADRQLDSIGFFVAKFVKTASVAG